MTDRGDVNDVRLGDFVEGVSSDGEGRARSGAAVRGRDRPLAPDHREAAVVDVPPSEVETCDFHGAAVSNCQFKLKHRNIRNLVSGLPDWNQNVSAGPSALPLVSWLTQ